MNVTLQVKKSNAESQVQLILILVSTPKLTRSIDYHPELWETRT